MAAATGLGKDGQPLRREERSRSLAARPILLLDAKAMAPFALLALLLAAGQPAPAQVPRAPDAAPLRPTAWPFRLFSEDDYPAAARRAREQGRVTYRIEIGPDGRVSGCAVRWSSGSPSLDAATCRIVSRRARFAPARDSEGRPVPDRRDGDVLWVLSPEGEEEGEGED